MSLRFKGSVDNFVQNSNESFTIKSFSLERKCLFFLNKEQ